MNQGFGMTSVGIPVINPTATAATTPRNRRRRADETVICGKERTATRS
jgi:hypothetical protein